MRVIAVILALVIQAGVFAYQVSCTSGCQHFDTFSNQCVYESKCTYQNKCMIYDYCEHFDTFENNCISEAKQTNCHVPNPYAGVPSCSESCQHYDIFQMKCLYKTRCDFNANCTTQTRCGNWDAFSETCLAEEKEIRCN